MVEGEIIEADPPRRLVHSWNLRYDPKFAGDAASQVTWEIASEDGKVSKLTVIHEFLSEDASYAEVASGWSWWSATSRLCSRPARRCQATTDGRRGQGAAAPTWGGGTGPGVGAWAAPPGEASSSARVILDRPGGAQNGLRGVLTEFAPSLALTEQVPALVEVDLHLP